MGNELIWAMRSGDISRLHEALRQYPDSINQSDDDGETVLMKAVRFKDDVEIVGILLDAGADLKAAQSTTGQTALHMAVRNQRIAVAVALIDAGADVNHRDRFGNIPIMYLPSNNSDLINRLVLAGSNLKTLNNYGVTPEELLRDIRNSSPYIPEELPAKDAPFMEHPTGEFDNAIQAIQSVMHRLKQMNIDDRWIIFSGQGQGHRPDSSKIVDVPFSGCTFDLSNQEVDLKLILNSIGHPNAKIKVKKSSDGKVSLPEASPKQLAYFLDALFRYHFGIIPYDIDEDYAVGAEWQRRGTL